MKSPFTILSVLFSIVAGLLCVQTSIAETWEIVNSGTTNDITGVAWDGRRFVAVDDQGGTLESPDGKNWNRRQVQIYDEFGDLEDSPSFHEIVYGNGLYLALDLIGFVYKSTNLITWTEQYTGESREDLDAETAQGGVYGNGRFVLVGDSGSIVNSSDGINWNPITSSPTTSELTRIAFDSGLFVAVGWDGIFTSADTIHWTPRKTSAIFFYTDAAFFGSRYVAITSDEISVSVDGKSWTTSRIATSNVVSYCNAVSGGPLGFRIVGDEGKSFSSNDGKTCSPVNMQTTSNLNDVAYGGGFYVAVGNRGLIRRFDTASAKPEIVIQQPKGRNLTDASGSRNFGRVITGKTKTLKFTLKNVGSANLTGISAKQSGKNSKDFKVTGLKQSLLPGASATFYVRFKPSAKGTRKALLKIKSNDADENPFDIELKGAGKK